MRSIEVIERLVRWRDPRGVGNGARARSGVRGGGGESVRRRRAGRRHRREKTARWPSRAGARDRVSRRTTWRRAWRIWAIGTWSTPTSHATACKPGSTRRRTWTWRARSGTGGGLGRRGERGGYRTARTRGVFDRGRHRGARHLRGALDVSSGVAACAAASARRRRGRGDQHADETGHSPAWM